MCLAWSNSLARVFARPMIWQFWCLVRNGALPTAIPSSPDSFMTEPSCRDRLEQALDRIADPNGEGARACLTVYGDQARAAADAADARAARGASLGPLDGVIVTVKDLFDVAGEVTRAGSKILAEEGKPATADAPVVQRLRAAGAVIVAKTNMTEFAFSGIGANPHFGTPGNPRDRTRVPGGSSSGAAVAVGDGLCDIAIGTDTGGSVRVPAGLCGLVGFKPSRQRVPTAGAFPLSQRWIRWGRSPTASRIAPRPTPRWPERRLRRSRRSHSAAFRSASPRVCRSTAWITLSPRRSFPPSHGLNAPVCGSPTKPCRCSTTWPASMPRRHLAAGSLRASSRPHGAPRRRYRP